MSGWQVLLPRIELCILHLERGAYQPAADIVDRSAPAALALSLSLSLSLSDTNTHTHSLTHFI